MQMGNDRPKEAPLHFWECCVFYFCSAKLNDKNIAVPLKNKQTKMLLWKFHNNQSCASLRTQVKNKKIPTELSVQVSSK